MRKKFKCDKFVYPLTREVIICGFHPELEMKFNSRNRRNLTFDFTTGVMRSSVIMTEVSCQKRNGLAPGKLAR